MSSIEPTVAETAAGRSPSRRLAVGLEGRPRVRLGLLLAGPLGWLGLAYIGSLVILFINAFWQRDVFTGQVERDFTLANFAKLNDPTFIAVLVRTVGMAFAVTLACAVLAFPVAYFMARVAGPRLRAALVIAVILPLWASYLIKVYSWRLIFSNEGVLNWVLRPLGLEGPGFSEIALWVVFTYLWLPFMIIPVYAGLERIPSSLLEASSDLGASWRTTFRRVIFPLAFPAIVAGSIFTFSLTLGDYIAPNLMTNGRQFVGNLIYARFGVPDLPGAAAQALVPLLIMLVYLLVARRLGAFEAL
jgi:putative spermidine/putrescine transport system permease protein